MKLQSQQTVRFERKELRRLARMTRPKKEPSIVATSLAGIVVGTIIVVVLRAFGY